MPETIDFVLHGGDPRAYRNGSLVALRWPSQIRVAISVCTGQTHQWQLDLRRPPEGHKLPLR